MIEEASLYHSVMAQLFLLLLLVNLLLPSLFKKERIREVRAVRMSFFLFSALLAMTAFTGMIHFMLMDIPWHPEMTGMVLLFLLLSAAEIMRSRKLRDAWLRGEDGVTASRPWVLIEIAMTLLMFVAVALER